jgi:hypothetical protein
VVYPLSCGDLFAHNPRNTKADNLPSAVFPMPQNSDLSHQFPASVMRLGRA